ncbi:hypothetical protein ANCDUO_22476 [Ancylostoma duodenale]|uniref:Uncharacterized protein n=1 Tax=Ancylostoma duodenale TaxID=51022 RepID=A0A0C2FL31_9BILA|nr:hypothetical protein ANCDUO_22476 [Ancylostoma duodenale]
MVSPRAIAGMSFCIRLFILCLAIVAMILILVAPGACFSRYLNGQPISREICPGKNHFEVEFLEMLLQNLTLKVQ